MGNQASVFTRAMLSTVAFAFAAGAAPFAQQSSVTVHGDDITMRGCVGRLSSGTGLTQPSLVWTRSDIMLSNAVSLRGDTPAPLADRVFYWLEDEEDLAKYAGQQVEIKGDLGDFKKGEIELKRDGAFTDIELDLGGRKDKARVPTAWLGEASGQKDVQIISRKVDVDKVTVLGPCERR